MSTNQILAICHNEKYLLLMFCCFFSYLFKKNNVHMTQPKLLERLFHHNAPYCKKKGFCMKCLKEEPIFLLLTDYALCFNKYKKKYTNILVEISLLTVICLYK